MRGDGLRHQVTIAPETAGDRLDRALAQALPDLSRSRLKALVESGHVRDAAGAAETAPSRKVAAGEVFEILVPTPPPASPVAQALPLTVVHEDADLIIVDKPPGLVVHPAPGNPDRTLVNALLAHCGETLTGIGGVRRPGIVHRLDKDTSGLMVAAKTERAHAGLAAQFAAHSLDRAYLAVVWGVPSPAHGEIKGVIGRSPRNRKKMAVLSSDSARGKPALTRYRILRALSDAKGAPVAALLECRLATGRTHQIRVHLTDRGHPLLGDPLYGRPPAGVAARLAPVARDALAALGRQALHARELGFVHPADGSRVLFRSPPPPDLARLLRAFGAPPDALAPEDGIESEGKNHHLG